jgi:tetratricopeptide (TPR) repeat protein
VAWHNRGQVHLALYQLDEARSDFDAALRLFPRYPDALAGRAYARAQLGDLEGGLDDCNEALQINAESDDALSCRGLVHRAQGAYDRSIEDFNAALELAPDRADVYRDRGLTRYFMEQYERALADENRALASAPKDALAWNNRAAARIKLGEYADALEDLDTALRLVPEMANPFKHIAWIRATCPHDEFRDGEAAVANATRAMELTEWKATDWLDVLAAAHAEAGNFDEAIRWQQKCIDEANIDNRSAMQSRLELYQAGLPYRDQPHERAVAATSA